MGFWEQLVQPND